MKETYLKKGGSGNVAQRTSAYLEYTKPSISNTTILPSKKKK